MSRGRLCDVKIEEQTVARKNKKMRKKNRMKSKKKLKNKGERRRKKEEDDVRNMNVNDGRQVWARV